MPREDSESENGSPQFSHMSQIYSEWWRTWVWPNKWS